MDRLIASVMQSNVTGWGAFGAVCMLLILGKLVPISSVRAERAAFVAERERDRATNEARLAREAEINSFLRQANDIEVAAHAVTRDQNVRLMAFAEVSTKAMQKVASAETGGAQ